MRYCVCDNKWMNRRHTLGVSIALLGLIIAALHYMANAYYLYWEWWWMDIVMHFLGGLFIASFVLWWIRYEVPISIRAKVPRFLVAFVAIIIVGTAWEVFEFVVEAHGAINYVLDTGLDLLMDIVGMLAAYLIFNRYGT